MDKKIRKAVQIGWTALTNGYLFGFFKGKIYTGKTKSVCVPGLNCYSCPGALGACPIGSLQATLNNKNFHISCYVVGILMFIGSLFGRFVCGWLCPFGLIQELCYKIPVFKKVKNLPFHKILIWLKYVVLAVFVLLLPALVSNAMGIGQPWYCEYICPSGTLLGGIPLVIANAELRAAIGWRFCMKVGILLVVLLLSVKYYRPFCKYLCPLGACYSFFNPIALYRFKVDADKCVHCGKCQKVCGMDVEVWKNPNSLECIRCGECKASCPTHAIETFSPLKELQADKKAGESHE